MTLLAGLTPVLSNCGAGQTLTLAVVTVKCPPMTQYPADMQKQAAAELRALPAGSAVGMLVNDYGTQRAKCRAYEAKP
jgi:hypothetical protein